MFGADCVEEHIAKMNAMEEKDGLKQALDVNEMNWAIFQESVAGGGLARSALCAETAA